MKEKTVEDFIKELQSLRPDLKILPIKIMAANGIMFEPEIKRLLGKNDTLYDQPKEMIITY